MISRICSFLVVLIYLLSWCYFILAFLGSPIQWVQPRCHHPLLYLFAWHMAAPFTFIFLFIMVHGPIVRLHSDPPLPFLLFIKVEYPNPYLSSWLGGVILFELNSLNLHITFHFIQSSTTTCCKYPMSAAAGSALKCDLFVFFHFDFCTIKKESISEFGRRIYNVSCSMAINLPFARVLTWWRDEWM